MKALLHHLAHLFHSPHSRPTRFSNGKRSPLFSSQRLLRSATQSFIAAAICILVLPSPTLGQGSESFDNSNATGSYADGSFVGDAGITWTYGHSRDEGDYPIDGNGLMLRRASDSYLEATIPGGVGTFSFEYRKAFSGNAARQLELIINGVQVATSPVFGDESGEDATVHTFTHAVNTSGNVVVRIKNVGETSTNRQLTLDNISWTEYTPATPTPTISTTGTPDFLYTPFGNASTSTSVEVEGVNLTDDITATAPSGFEVSRDDENWGPMVSFTEDEGEAGGTLYMRISGSAAVGSIMDSIALTSEDATDVNIEVEGEVLPENALAFYPFTDNTVSSFYTGDDLSADDLDISSGSVGHGTAQSETWTGSGVPYAQGSQGWDESSQETAKYFTFTLEPDAPLGLTVTNVSFLARATGAGPSALGIHINGTDISATVTDVPDSETTAYSFPISGFEHLSGEVEIRIQGWDNGSRGTTGGGAFRIDDVLVEGTVDSIPVVPVLAVMTGPATDVTANAATLAGEVTDDGGSQIIERGVVLSTTASPTTNDTVLVDSHTEVGTFSVPATGLSPNQTYHYRAYAINDEAIAYGSDETFSTLPLAAPTAEAATAITKTSFVANWTAVDAATSYRLDVATESTFGTVEDEEDIFNEEMRAGEIPEGWTAVDIDARTVGDGYLLFEESASTLTSPIYDLSGYQNVALTFDVAKFGSGTDGPLTVEVSIDGGETWDAQTFDSPVPDDANYVTSGPTAITALSDEVRFRWTRESSPSQKRLRDIVLTGQPFTPAYVDGYENLLVEGTSETVTGLTQGTQYFYRVRAVDGAETSPNSNVIEVETLPIQPTLFRFR